MRLLLAILFSVIIPVLAVAQDPSPPMESTESKASSVNEVNLFAWQRRSDDIQVELVANLTFAAKDWDCFFIQGERAATMVWCKRAIATELSQLPVGTPLRLWGKLASDAMFFQVDRYEVVSKDAQPTELAIPEISVTGDVACNGLVRVSGRVFEGFCSSTETSLCASLSILALQFQYYGASEIHEIIPLIDQVLTAQGAICAQHESNQFATYNLRIMRRDQMETDSWKSNMELFKDEEVIKKYYDVFTGQVLYTDQQSSVLLATEQGVRAIHTRFANRLRPGDRATVYSRRSQGAYTTKMPIESALLHLVSNDTLPPSFATDVPNLLRTRLHPERVSTTAKVVNIQEDRRTYLLKVHSDLFNFHAVIPSQDGNPVPSVEAGDLVQLTGTPIITGGAREPTRLTLYLASKDDLITLRKKSQIPLKYWILGVVAVFGIFSAAVAWNWLLRRSVASRTFKLNQVTTHLQKSFDAIREAVLINDKHQLVTNKNHRFQNIFGFEPEVGGTIHVALDQIVGRALNRDDFLRFRDDALNTREPSKTMILSMASPMREISVFVSSISDRKGAHYGNIWTFEDITEKLQAESDLLQAQKMDAIGQLSGGIAHDFRNLLTVIRSSLRLILISSAAKRPIEDHCQSAEIAVEQASELTQQLLDFSRLSVMSSTTLDANQVARQAFALVRRTIDARIQMRLELCRDELPIDVDATRLQQVIINLCINARDAMPSNKGMILVRTRIRQEEFMERKVVISVDDNGIGIPDEIRTRIFEPFFTTKEAGCGTGLGLSVALGIVEQHGGQIRCNSTMGQGSSFEIILPLSERPVEVQSPHDVDLSVDYSPMKLMLVDDEPQVLETAKALLESLGHEVVTAVDGMDALEQIAMDTDLDAVLLDMTMPRMSGVETCLEIQRLWPHIGVAICTGYALDTKKAFRGNEKAVPPIISKPYQLEEIQVVLSQITARKSMVS